MTEAAPPSPGRWRDDRGATSVVFALVAMLLLAVAALAVDLTNLYAQRTVAQSRADAAAFAAAQALPDACDAVDAARQSLLDTGGPRSADEAAPVVQVYATDPRDEDGDPATPPPPPPTLASTRPDCSTAGASVQVSTPPRTVPFVFAGVFDLFQEGSGVSSTSVSAVARVRLAEPDLMPLVLPRHCLGDVFVLTTRPAADAPPDGPPSAPSSAEPSPEPSPEPGPGEPTCAALDPAAGLGVLDSPVRSGEPEELRFRLNLRDGIDHAVEALDPPAVPEQRCAADDSPSGAVLDRSSTSGTPNCLRVSTLPDTPAVRIELQQRFDATTSPDRCPSVPGAGAWRTVEACYLLDGFDRGDVLDADRSGSPPPLDDAILADPRFFVVPQLDLSGPAAVGDFVPVLRLMGGFSVGEDLSADGTLPAFVFPLEALPRMVIDPGADRPRTLVLTSPVGAPAPGGGP